MFLCLLIAAAAMAQMKDTLTDERDGQGYQTVKIGKQWWMAENLNYNAQGSYCYEKDTGLCNTYGRLYTWEATKNVCPAGWHLPSDEEWTTMTDELGGDEVAGIKLIQSATKSSGASQAGMNSSGFSALPAGNRTAKGTFTLMGSYAIWWTATEYNTGQVWTRYLYWSNNYIYSHYDKKACAFSVRCIKNKH